MVLSVIIVNYNTTEHLRSCLDSIFKYTANIEFEVIIVDNNSPNREIETIIIDFPSIKLFLRKKNDGFGAGCNFGANKANGKYLAFINPDVIIASNIFKDYAEKLDNNENIAVISPMYIDKDNDNAVIPINKEIPGYNWAIAEAFGNIVNRITDKIKINDSKSIVGPFFVDWVMGSFIFIRSYVFAEVAGFDEDFFLYYEDIDLQLRIRKQNHLIQYDPSHFIKHFERSSIRTFKGENIYYYHMTRSHLLYSYKHFGFLMRLNIRILHLLGIVLRILLLPFRSDFTEKRAQKLLQYCTKFKQYAFYGKNKLIKSKYAHLQFSGEDKKQISSKDKFWK